MKDDIYVSDDLPLIEYRYADFEETDGRTLIGTVVRYGDVSTRNTYGGAEQFESGAFGNVGALDTILNYQHNRQRPLARTNGGGLVLQDDSDALRVAATLPETRDADDALEMVDKGILRGFSTEFIARRESDKNGVRTIQQAALPGIGLVDRPSYPDSVIAEIRAEGEGISGEFAYDTDAVIAATGKVRKERIRPGAFSYAISAPDREINLVLGDNSRPLASKRAGSLELKDTPTALKFRVKQLPRTSYVADFLGMLRGKSIVPGIVPFFQPTPSSVARRLFSNGKAVEEEPEEGNTGVFRRVVKSGLLTALSILFRPRRGNPGSVTALPRRLRRTRVPNTVNAVRPRRGDVIRNGRVIRFGRDIGPVATRRMVL